MVSVTLVHSICGAETVPQRALLVRKLIGKLVTSNLLQQAFVWVLGIFNPVNLAR